MRLRRYQERQPPVESKRLFRSKAVEEQIQRIQQLLKNQKMLMDTEAGTGFMHESFHKDNPAKFTHAWFAWQNTLFGELILKLVNEGKLDLLNSIQ